MKLGIFSTDFRILLVVQFHENPSSASRVVPCGLTDMTKLIDAFRNFANAPKNRWQFSTMVCVQLMWQLGPSYSITIVTSVTILWKSYKNSIRSSARTFRSAILMHKKNTRLRKGLCRMRN